MDRVHDTIRTISEQFNYDVRVEDRAADFTAGDAASNPNLMRPHRGVDSCIRSDADYPFFRVVCAEGGLQCVAYTTYYQHARGILCLWMPRKGMAFQTRITIKYLTSITIHVEWVGRAAYVVGRRPQIKHIAEQCVFVVPMNCI